MGEDVKHRGAITAFIISATTMQTLDTTIANIALPHMQGSFSASQDQINWVLTSYIVAAAIATPPTGWLSRRFGRARLLEFAVAGFTVASVLCGISQSLEEMVLFRLLQGLCGACFVPLSQAVMLDIYPKERQGWAMALWGVGVMIGPILGPTIGGWLTENLDWRWVFLINLPVGVVTWVGLVTFLPERRSVDTMDFDWFGFATLSLAIGALQLMLDRGEQLDWFSSPEIITEAVISGLAFYLFLVQLLTVKHPFISPGVFKDRNLTISVAFIFALAVLMLGSMALVTPFLQAILGYPVVTAGLALAPRGIGTMVAMFTVGYLLGRIDVRFLLLFGLTLLTYTLWAMCQFTTDEPESIVVLNGLVQGFGLGFLFVPLSTVAFATLPPTLRAEGAAIFSLARNIGGAIGISIFVGLLDRSTQANHADIAAYVTPFNRMLDVGAMLGTKAQVTAMTLDSEVMREASTIAYLNDFRVMMWLGLALVPLVLLLRVQRQPAVESPAAAFE
ncbi:MAG TPA: DHA2 family efflux MFS transporter permease subunit [Stellaceae bacterium]|nr:DHA2 family efflux MFS transporter permease subunit [Stellaceae bacterium]